MQALALRSDVEDVGSSQEQTGSARTEGLSQEKWAGIVEDIRDQPAWRVEADRAADYYDGNQLDHQTLALLKERGMGPLITNLIKPTVDVVLGMEAKARTDWTVLADEDSSQIVAEAQSAQLHEVERETHADRARSDAYASQVKVGLGVVEISRNKDPFRYKYRVTDVHRREFFWDFRARDPLLADATYEVRKRWFDLDHAIAVFPQHEKVLRAAVDGWTPEMLDQVHTSETLAQAFDDQRRWSVEDYEWRNAYSKRVMLFECWYRSFVRGYVLRMQNGRVVELDMQNRMHQYAIAQQLARPEMAVYSRLRMSIWAGPFRLHDCACQQQHTNYVPFFGFREDLTGAPYGLIRAMLSPQDEINARRQRLMWLLAAKRVEMDEDALATRHNDISTLLREVGRPDGVVVLNQNRKHRDGFRVETDFGLAEQQFKVMLEAKSALQESAGLFNAMLGRTDQADSGVAIASLVEQGATVLGEINDNFRFSSSEMGNRLLDMLRDDTMGQPVQVMVGRAGRRKPVVLNERVQDEQGQEQIVNDVFGTRTKVALAEAPETPAYRAQQQVQLAQIMQGLDPQLKAVLIPFWIESSQLPNRQDISDLFRRQLGMPEKPEDMTPEEQQAMQQQQAVAEAQAQSSMKAMELDLAEKAAKVALMQAQAEKAQSEIGENQDGEQRAEFERRIQDLTTKHKAELERVTEELVRTRAKRDQDAIRLMLAQGRANPAAEEVVSRVESDAIEGLKVRQAETMGHYEAELQALRDEIQQAQMQAQAPKSKRIRARKLEDGTWEVLASEELA